MNIKPLPYWIILTVSMSMLLVVAFLIWIDSLT